MLMGLSARASGSARRMIFFIFLVVSIAKLGFLKVSAKLFRKKFHCEGNIFAVCYVWHSFGLLFPCFCAPDFQAAVFCFSPQVLCSIHYIYTCAREGCCLGCVFGLYGLPDGAARAGAEQRMWAARVVWGRREALFGGS